MAKARSRKKAAPAESTTPESTAESPITEAARPDIFDEQIEARKRDAAQHQAAVIVHDLAEHTRLPADAERQAAHETGRASRHEHGHAARHHQHRDHATGHIANPSSTRRESHAASVGRRLPSTMSVKAGDLMVKLIDKGDNLAGIGIQVVFPEDRAPTEEEKAIIRKHVKGEEGEHTGFSYNRDVGMWAKQIVRENEFEDQVPPSRPVAIRLDAERRVEVLAEALRQHQADPVGYADMVKQRREQASESRIPD